MQPSTRTYAEMFVARALAMLGPFGVAIITARMLGPEDRGRYYYLITLAAIGAQLASLGIHASNSYLVARDPKLLPPLLTNSLWVAVVGGAVAACGLVAFDLWGGEALHRAALVLVVFAAGPLILLFLYLTNLAVALNRPRLFNGLVIFSSIATLLAAGIVAVVSPTLNVFLIAAILAMAASSGLAWYALAHDQRVPLRFNTALFKQGIAFALRAHVAGLVGFLMARINIIVLRQYGSFADVGYWSVAAQIADALLLLPATVALLLFPALVRAEGTDRWVSFKSALLRVALLMAVICGVAALLARPAITLIFGTAFAPAIDLLLALLPGVFLLSLTTVLSQFLSAFGIPWLQVAAWITACLIQIALSVWVSQSYGAIGLAWLQSACAGVVCVWLGLMAITYRPRDVRA